jgi:(2Fe-2S) ferredoxin
MDKFKKHVFVCENVRDKDNPTPSCGRSGGIENRAKLKKRLKELGVNNSIRANGAGCLGFCQFGPVMVVYPEANWYGEVKIDDIEEIFKKDLMENRKVDRLEIEDLT